MEITNLGKQKNQIFPEYFIIRDFSLTYFEFPYKHYQLGIPKSELKKLTQENLEINYDFLSC